MLDVLQPSAGQFVVVNLAAMFLAAAITGLAASVAFRAPEATSGAAWVFVRGAVVAVKVAGVVMVAFNAYSAYIAASQTVGLILAYAAAAVLWAVVTAMSPARE